VGVQEGRSHGPLEELLVLGHRRLARHLPVDVAAHHEPPGPPVLAHRLAAAIVLFRHAGLLHGAQTPVGASSAGDRSAPARSRPPLPPRPPPPPPASSSACSSPRSASSGCSRASASRSVAASWSATRPGSGLAP